MQYITLQCIAMHCICTAVHYHCFAVFAGNLCAKIRRIQSGFKKQKNWTESVEREGAIGDSQLNTKQSCDECLLFSYDKRTDRCMQLT